MNSYKAVVLLSISATLFACGGGGSETEAPAPIPSVSPSNQAPSISAIPDQSVNENDSLTISATANDSDGSIASYLWEHESRFEIELNNADTSTVSFTAVNVINNQNLTLKLTVSDGELTASGLVNITIVDSDDENIYINNLSPFTIADNATTESEYFNVENWGLEYFLSTETYTDTVCYPTPDDCVTEEDQIVWWQQEHSEAGDLNGDGFEDLVITGKYFPHSIPLDILDRPRIFLNDGNGHLVPANEMIVNYNSVGRESLYHTEVADFNSDGFDDILSATLGRFETNPDGTITEHPEDHLLLLSDGNGNLIDSSSLIGGFGDNEFHTAHDLSVGDINGDGHIDYQAGNYLGINNGDGSFRRLNWPDTFPPFFKWAGAMSSLIADFNNDGFDDIAKFMFDSDDEYFGSADMYIILSNGTPDISKWAPVIIGKGIFGSNTKHNHANFADFNNDGYLDFVVGQTRAEPYYVGRALDIYMNKGDGTFDNTTSVAIDNSSRSDLDILNDTSTVGNGEGTVVLRDFNNDGFIDIIDLTSGEGSIGLFANDGTGKFTHVSNDVLAYIAPSEIAERQQENGDKNTTFYSPINLDNQHGLDFVTTTHIFWDKWPKPTKFELVYYELKSKRVINITDE
jgi:hypothetical protein